MLSEFLQLIYPNQCAICAEPLTFSDAQWCLTCDLRLPKTYLDPEYSPMHKALGHLIPIKIGYAPYYFKKGNATQQLLHKLKYKNEQAIGNQLGHIIGDSLHGLVNVAQFDCIVPIPLHASKLLVRGYNQAEVIASPIAQLLKIPLIKDCLQRNKTTTTQTKKSRYKRWTTIDEAFYISDVSVFEYKHVVLVDDVFTTGATIGASLRELSKIRGIEISVVTAAIADY